jgi:hypothetical protein
MRALMIIFLLALGIQSLSAQTPAPAQKPAPAQSSSSPSKNECVPTNGDCNGSKPCCSGTCSPHGGYVYLQDKNGRDVTCLAPTADCICK